MPEQLTPLEDETVEHEPIKQDDIAEEVYASRLYTKRVTRTVVRCLAATQILSLLVIYGLASRPPKRIYIKVDEFSRATPVKYTDIENYTPDAGVARNYLSDWATLRYSRLRATVLTTFPRNYLFLEKKYGTAVERRDQDENVVAKVLAGREPENDVKILSTNLTSFGKESMGLHVVTAGTADIALQKIYTKDGKSHAQTWIIAVRFYIDPAQVGQQSAEHPEYQTINPLGLTIVEFIPNRTNVEASTKAEQ